MRFISNEANSQPKKAYIAVIRLLGSVPVFDNILNAHTAKQAIKIKISDKKTCDKKIKRAASIKMRDKELKHATRNKKCAIWQFIDYGLF